MMTIAIILLIVAVLAIAYAKSQPRGQAVFVSTHVEVLPDGTSRDVKSWTTSTDFAEMDDRFDAIRRHNLAMVVAGVAAFVGGFLVGATVMIGH